jgi:hypothetical protein
MEESKSSFFEREVRQLAKLHAFLMIEQPKVLMTGF